MNNEAEPLPETRVRIKLRRDMHSKLIKLGLQEE